MPVRMSALTTLSLSVALGLFACSDSKKDKSGPCARGELEACGQSCGRSAECPSGLYCEDGACHAECSPNVSGDCAASESCSSQGQCETRVIGNRDGGDDTEGGSSSLDGGSESEGGGSCGEVELSADPQTPNVIFIIDQSSSMDAKFGSGTRWTVLKQSLLADNGLIAELQDRVRFGVALYSSRNGNQNGAMCPLISDTSIAFNNLPTIRELYQPADMIDDTPTGEAVDAVLTKVQSTLLDPDAKKDPTIFVLATDGEPDTCALPDGNNTSRDGRPQSIAAVKRAFEAGIRTYVIAVANESELSQAHVNDLANTGVGNTGSTPAPSFRPNNDQGLRDALRSIVTGVQSCDVPLKGTVTATACEATVKVDGKEIPCTGENGFELLNPSTLRVKGTACTDVKAGKFLSATFPCGGAVPVL